jgi:hypothetical protein
VKAVPRYQCGSSSRSGHRDGARTGAVAFYAGLAAAYRNRSGPRLRRALGPTAAKTSVGCGSTAIRGCGWPPQAFTPQDFARCVRRV